MAKSTVDERVDEIPAPAHLRRRVGETSVCMNVEYVSVREIPKQSQKKKKGIKSRREKRIYGEIKIHSSYSIPEYIYKRDRSNAETIRSGPGGGRLTLTGPRYELYMYAKFSVEIKLYQLPDQVSESESESENPFVCETIYSFDPDETEFWKPLFLRLKKGRFLITLCYTKLPLSALANVRVERIMNNDKELVVVSAKIKAIPSVGGSLQLYDSEKSPFSPVEVSDPDDPQNNKRIIRLHRWNVAVPVRDGPEPPLKIHVDLRLCDSSRVDDKDCDMEIVEGKAEFRLVLDDAKDYVYDEDEAHASAYTKIITGQGGSVRVSIDFKDNLEADRKKSIQMAGERLREGPPDYYKWCAELVGKMNWSEEKKAAAAKAREDRALLDHVAMQWIIEKHRRLSYTMGEFLIRHAKLVKELSADKALAEKLVNEKREEFFAMEKRMEENRMKLAHSQSDSN